MQHQVSAGVEKLATDVNLEMKIDKEQDFGEENELDEVSIISGNGDEKHSVEAVTTKTIVKQESAVVVMEDELDSKETQKQSNSYAAKKTVAQGMMDIALITANANQLRYIIEFNSESSTYYLNLFLIVISLLLQIAVGISLIFKGRFDLKGQSKHAYAKRINNYVVVGVFLVTIINVFIASFTITGGPRSSLANQ